MMMVAEEADDNKHSNFVTFLFLLALMCFEKVVSFFRSLELRTL